MEKKRKCLCWIVGCGSANRFFAVFAAQPVDALVEFFPGETFANLEHGFLPARAEETAGADPKKADRSAGSKIFFQQFTRHRENLPIETCRSREGPRAGDGLEIGIADLHGNAAGIRSLLP